MTWTKLSDDFTDECWDLSDAAFRLLVEMLTFSNRKLLDCTIPKEELRRFAKRPEAVDELTQGKWIIDEGRAYRVVFHSAFQPTREKVIATQERSRENGAKGGRPAKPGRERKPVTQPGTRVGFDEGPETQQLTQAETQRVGTGRAIYGEVVSETKATETQADVEDRTDSRTGEVFDEPRTVHREGNRVRLMPRSA